MCVSDNPAYAVHIAPSPMAADSTALLCHITPRASGTSPIIFLLILFNKVP